MTVYRISLLIFAVFFIIAGLNHFNVPEVYLKIIPPYLPFPEFLNYLSGAIEIVCGALLLFPATRRAGAAGIIALLIVLLPAHIYMIQLAPFNLGNLHVTPLIAWLRLPIQLMLIWWAYKYYKD